MKKNQNLLRIYFKNIRFIQKETPMNLEQRR